MPDIEPSLTALSRRLASLAEGRASAPRLRDGIVTLVLDVTGLSAAERTAMEGAIRMEALKVEGVSDVRVAMTAEKRAMRIIAVGSGKGGVGKSTLSANLAIALKRLGMSVGLVDADIHGPSLPRLMASEGVRPRAEDKQLMPVTGAGGVPMLSMGHLAEPGKAIAWRGPMAASALGQLIDARWEGMDTLVVDLPPGTGDVQLSMIQKHKPTGAVIVSTPQDLALIDAARAISLFDQAGVPTIGLVENMAGYACPHCGKISDPFGRGGVEEAAERMGAAFLGRIPLDLSIRVASDDGAPPALGDDANARCFLAIAERVKAWLEARASL